MDLILLFDLSGSMIPRLKKLCHPSGDSPRQGDMSRLHQPLVSAAQMDLGAIACARTTALLVACALEAVFCAEGLNFAQLRIFPTTSQDFSLFAELCCAVLLFQLCRAEVAQNPTALPRSGPFFAITKASGLWGGLWIAIGCFQVVATPFVYAVVRHIASENGRPSPQFVRMLVQNIEKFVNVLGLWITPWLVYTIDRRSNRARSIATESG